MGATTPSASDTLGMVGGFQDPQALRGTPLTGRRPELLVAGPHGAIETFESGMDGNPDKAG